MDGTVAEALKMYETENDISEKRRAEVGALLDQRTAVDRQTQLRQA